MKPTTLVLLVIIAGVLLGMLFTSDHYRNEQIKADEKERKGKDVLQIIIDSTKNKDPFFNSSLKGKIVVINIWSPKFLPCRKQIPDLNKLVKDFGNDKTVFVALDAGESSQDMDEMKKENIKFDYQLLFGKSQLLRIIFESVILHEGLGSGGGGSFPINMVLSPDGGVELFYAGYHEEELENIRNYLAAAEGKM